MGVRRLLIISGLLWIQAEPVPKESLGASILERGPPRCSRAAAVNSAGASQPAQSTGVPAKHRVGAWRMPPAKSRALAAAQKYSSLAPDHVPGALPPNFMGQS